MSYHLFFRILFLAFLTIIPLTVIAQQVPITFNVKMGYQMELGNFDPVTNFVDIAGTFNGWGSSSYRLSNDSDDSTYSTTIQGFTAGTTIEFKFRIDGAWDGREEFPNGGANRSYKVKSSDNTITVWYNDTAPPSGPPMALFKASATTIYENGTVLFTNHSEGKVSEWQWFFEGGSPSESTDKEPLVKYENMGTFDVTLIAIDGDLRDTLIFYDFITVSQRNTTETYWWNETVFYELFVRSFFDSDGDGTGDFKGIIEKLDYLNDGNPHTNNDLGITGIWLMPIHESPSYHGYDVTDYRSVNSDYGTMDDFKLLIQEAKGRGIKVVIDFIANHTSTEHEWFKRSAQNSSNFRNFYRWENSHPGYNGPWGQNVWHQYGSGYYYGLFWSGMPDLNYAYTPVKDSVFAAVDFWLNDIGVDGFRLDAVLYIHEDGSQLEHTDATFNFWNEFNSQVKTSNPDAFTVGEAWANTETILNYVINDRIDYAFDFDLASAIINAANYGNNAPLYAQAQKVYDSYNYLQFGTFLTNHDQNRLMSVLDKDVNKNKAAASIYLTLPGIPYLYYGEEIGMTGTKPDEYIRTPMQWNNTTYAGFSTAKPWFNVNADYTTINVEAQTAEPLSLLSHYRNLIRIRNQSHALKTGEYQAIKSSSENLFSFLRNSTDETVLVVVNTTSSTVENISFQLPTSLVPTGDYFFYELQSKSETLISVDENGYTTPINIEAYETLLIKISEQSLVSVRETTSLPQNPILHQNYPNPFNPETTLSFTISKNRTHTKIYIFDILGQVIRILDAGVLGRGNHTLLFNGNNLASGVYFYTLMADNDRIETRKMILLK